MQRKYLFIQPRRQAVLFSLVVAVSMGGCSLTTNQGRTEENDPTLTSPAMAAAPTSSPSAVLTTSNPTSTADFSPTPTQTADPSSTPSATPSPTVSTTPTVTPTYAIIRAKVLEQSNCRYGPGAPYLYKFGLYPETVLEVVGRNELGTWVLIQAVGGDNRCWVNARQLELRGEVMTVEPTYTPLPQSPYYSPPTGVSAARDGDEVTVSWYGIQLRPGDDSLQTPYLVEAWVCTGGKLTFTPVGSYLNAVTIIDEPGCSEPSHARLLAAEKHGYTVPVEIPWPAKDEE